MNYDGKPYVPVFSPPGQYMARIPSPNAAHLPTSYHLVPVKCSQGMIQTSPSNQYKQIFYSTPPPPPPPWACDFKTHPLPTAAAIPFIDGQAMIPGFRNSLPPGFHSPFLQEKRKTEFQPGSWHTPKAQSPESVFKQAALRNGIRVEEESPKKGKAVGTSQEKKNTSRVILPNNQGDDSSGKSKVVKFSKEQDESQDSLAASCRDISLTSRKTSGKLPPEDYTFNHTCSEQTVIESSSTTQMCTGVHREGLAGDNSNLNKPDAIGRNFGYSQLNSVDLWEENENKRLDRANATAMCLPSKNFIGARGGSFNGDSPEAARCNSKIAPSVETNTNVVEENHEKGLDKTNTLDPPNEVLIEDFVLNVIFCAVNSLLRESGKQNGGFEKLQEGFELQRINRDGQEDEKVLGKVSDLSMDSKVDNDRMVDQLEGEMDAFARPVLENEIDSENVSPINDHKGSAETTPNQAESLPNPAEALSYPNESIPNPAEMISNSKESLSNPDETIPNPAETISNPKESSSNPDETVPNSTERVPILSEPMVSIAEEISSNKLHDPVKGVSLYAEQETKSPEDQEVEDLFIKLALKKGIKVGIISPPSTNDLDSAPESSGRENLRFQKDKEVEDLFVRRALQKGIKVGRISPTNSSNVEPGSYGRGKVQSPQDQDMEDLFVRLALEKGIKVGNVSPVNETSAQHDAKNTKIGEEFEKRALRNGIRLERSGITTMEPSHGNTTSYYLPGAIPGSKADSINVMEKLVPRTNSVKTFPDGDWLNSVTMPLVPNPLNDGVFGTNVVPSLARYSGMNFNTLVKFDTNVRGRMDWTNNEPGYRKTTLFRQESFEEHAKRNGIRVGEILKRKVDLQTQTENSVKSQDTQTIGLIKVENATVQVDATKEALKKEYDEWMQEELSLIDPKASSFRELFLLEEEARTEAERRLAVEMDENVKAQRNTKILIDDLKIQLVNKDEAIEKLMKELKSLKKQKDNEIKRLTKEVKQKDEDLETATHENCLKDVVIENLREIIKEQNEMVEKMEEKLKVMEREMENEREKSDSLFKIESSKDISQQTKGTNEWQFVQGRHSGAKGTMKPKSSVYHQIDGLSEFDDKEFEKYNSSRSPSNTTTCIAQGNPSEEITSEESLPSKNEGSVPPRQDALLNLGGARNSVTREYGMATAYNQQSASGDRVPRLSKEASLAAGRTLGPPLPPPGIYMPGFPRELNPVFVGNSNTSSTHFVCRNNVTLNTNGLYTSPGAYATTLTSSGIMQQELPRVPYPLPGGAGNATLLPPGVPQQVLPVGLYSLPTASDAIMPTSVVTNHDLPRAPYPTPGSSTPPPPPGITVDPALIQARPVISSKNKTSNKFSSFDKLMETLRDSFPDHSRPSLMVCLKKAKEAFGTNGFKGKQISEIVDKVAQVIHQE